MRKRSIWYANEREEILREGLAKFQHHASDLYFRRYYPKHTEEAKVPSLDLEHCNYITTYIILSLLHTAIIPSTQDNDTALIAGAVAAVVLFLLLLGGFVVATGFCVAVCRKRRAVPIQSNPNPAYEVVQDDLKRPAVADTDPTYEVVQDVIPDSYIMTQSTAYGVIEP